MARRLFAHPERLPRGPFECVKAVLPVMRCQRYGKIINIASGTVF
jgi:NAD(P)-dependent dehydrogenase (short-subunit alcohol dehydrogenase family)